MLEIVCWTKKFRWGLTNLWVPYSRKSYRFSIFEATSSNVSSWQEEPKIFENPPTLLTQRYQINGVRLLDFSLVHSTLKVHHRAKPKTFHIATLVWLMWSLFIFGFYEKKKKKRKKSMWFKTFWLFNHSESPLLRSPVKPQPKMRNFTTDSQSPII